MAIDTNSPTTFTSAVLITDIIDTNISNGQLAETTSTPGAALDVNSTEGGIMFPRMTTAERLALPISSSQNSNTVYDTDLNDLYTVQNGLWGAISTDTGAAAKFILQTADANYPAAQSLGTLTTGLLKNTVTGSTGVLSTAVAGTDYYSPSFPTIIRDDHVTSLSIGFTAGNGTNLGSYVLIGQDVATNSITATNMVGIGVGVLNSVTTGDGNIGIGSTVLQACTVGANNIAMGTNSLKSLVGGLQNVALGLNCAQNLAAGDDNILIGYQSFDSATNASGSISIGRNSGSSQAAYTNCVFLGFGADANANSLSNAVAIGNNAIVGQSNTCVIGDGTMKVGIGTPIPTAFLQVVTTTGIGSIVEATGFNAVQAESIGASALVATSTKYALQMTGAMSAATTSTSSTNYTILDSDFTIFLTNSANQNVILPAISPNNIGRIIKIKGINGNESTRLITVTTTGGANVDGASGVAPVRITGADYGGAIFTNDGTNWWSIGNIAVI